MSSHEAPAGAAPTRSVIVIGAGVAGLAAAQRLKAHGFAVTLLEARERVGGRVWSCTNSTGTTLELGASWIHGYQAEFEAFVASMKLVQQNTDFTAMRFYSPRDGAVDISDQMYADLVGRIGHAIHQSVMSDINMSIQSMLDTAWSSGGFQGYARELVDFFTTAAFDLGYAATAGQIPVRAFLEYQPSQPGPDDVPPPDGPTEKHNTALPQGFSQVIDRLKAGLDIELNAVVARIEHPAEEELVTVTTTSGAQHRANHVLVTVPIGVLKAGAIAFEPPLPAEKQDAIERMGSGLLNKVFLEFRPQDQFWPSGPDAPEVFGTSSPQRGAFSVWINMQKLTGKPILMAWTSGDAARTIEQWDDQKTKNAALAQLRETFPGAIPEPINATITRWNQDPFARGTYSTFAQTTQLGDRALLREPVTNNKVLFAGEATVDRAYAQMPGAYASGVREADRLNNLAIA